MAGTLTGTVLHQAVLHHHQRQPTVDDQLAGNCLAQIPDLGHGHFKAQAGGGQLQLPAEMQGLGIVDIQAKIAVDGKADLSCGDEQAQIANQHIPDTLGIQIPQAHSQSGQLLIVDDPGQHRSHIAPANQLTGQAAVREQNMHRHIEHGGFHRQQLTGQLILICDLDGDTRHAAGAQVILQLGRLAQGLLVVAGTDGGELIQHIPAHGVDGSGGQGQARIHMGLDTHAAVGSAAGLADPVGNGLSGQLHIPGSFRSGAFHIAAAAFRIGHRQAAEGGGHHGLEGDIHQGAFAGFIGLAGGLDPGGIILGLLADTEHLPVHIAGIIAVGKALAVEGGHQRLLHGPGHSALIQGTAVGSGNGSHIFGLLHPAFQLQGCHTHLLQLLQVVDQAVVLQAQGILFLPVGIAVALAAGLGAAAPVAGASADERGHIALAGIAHAQSAVTEDLDLDGGIGADVLDLLPVQLPAQDHPAHAHGGTQLDTCQIVNGHLGGAVEGHMGGDLAAQLHNAQVLDDEGIHTGGGRMADQITEFFGFPVGNQGIQGQMHLNTPDVAVLDRLRQGLGGEILGALAGIKGAAAQIDRICAILHRSAQGIHRARRG